jgi:hypothetical protein
MASDLPPMASDCLPHQVDIFVASDDLPHPLMASDCLPHQVDIFVAELVAMTKQHGRTAPRRENSPLTLLSSKAWGAHRAGHD